MIEVVTKGGKKIGQISDEADQRDTIIVDGKSVPLEDAYNDDSIKERFNEQVKELRDDSGEDYYSRKLEE